MLNLGRVLSISICLSFVSSYAASVKSMVDTIEVVKGNPVTLRIKAIGSNAIFPNLSKIENSIVLATSTSNSRNMSIVNGSMNTEQSVTKTLQFMPEQNMTIPSYTVNIEGVDYRTDTIDITVVKSYDNSLQGNENFSLKMQTNKNKVMMGEPFVVTVYFALREGIRLAQDVQYSAPNISDFIATNVSEQKIYTKGNYQIQEIRYIVTPQKEGNFSIAPAQAKIGIPDRSRRDIFGLSFATKWMQTRSNSLSIEVYPLDNEAELIGDFSIDINIDKKEVEKNKPVNLTLKIEGKGSLEGFEFPEYQIDGVTVYTDEAKTETKIVDGEIYSIYTKSFAFISDSDFTIPTRELNVYSTVKKEAKVIELKGFEIKIEGSKVVAMATSSHSQTTTKSIQADEEEAITKEVEVQNTTWWMMVLSFLFGTLAMYVVPFLPKLFKKEKAYKNSDALKILYGRIGESKEVEHMVRKLYAKKNGDKSILIDKKELKKMLDKYR